MARMTLGKLKEMLNDTYGDGVGDDSEVVFVAVDAITGGTEWSVLRSVTISEGRVALTDMPSDECADYALEPVG